MVVVAFEGGDVLLSLFFVLIEGRSFFLKKNNFKE